ncbi:hypothetical protein [Polaromonas sp.]|uniref:hypothetical protein n=1 Tax=Polaromonas sp. TaxID=1869339 RepID=UPI003263E216
MSQETRYWLAFLTHPFNQAMVLGGAAIGVLASLPLGWDALALVMLGIAALEVLGLAIVPGLPSFRKVADEDTRRRLRKARRERLLEEIAQHGGSSYLGNYQQMSERVQSLYRTAADTSTALTGREVEQLEDLCVSYLAMCLSDAAMSQQDVNDLAGVAERKLRGVEQKLQKGGTGGAEEQQFRRARAEYEEVLARQARMISRRSILEANLVSMPMRMEEVYQMVLASPGSGDLGALLEESVAKLRAAEEVTVDVEAAFGLKSMTSLPSRLDGVPEAAKVSRAVGSRE